MLLEKSAKKEKYIFDLNFIEPHVFRLRYLFQLRFCSRYRSEAQKTLAKRAVGAILRGRHIHRYVKEQNRVVNDNP